MSVHALHPAPETVTEPLHAVAHQFKTADQQREAVTLGMWLFLSTEILFFGALFVAYAVYRVRFPEGFRQGSIDLKWYLGGFNTGVLLVSSFFMALAVHESQKGDNPAHNPLSCPYHYHGGRLYRHQTDRILH